MTGEVRVLLVGADATAAEAAGALGDAGDALQVSTTLPSSVGETETETADCVVLNDSGELDVPGLARAVRAVDDSIPVVAFGDGDAVDALEGPVTDYVRRGSGQHAVLANRIERLVEAGDVASDGGSALDDRERVAHSETLNRISDAIVSFDDEWRFTYVNDRAEDLLDVSSDALVGECAWDVFPGAVGTPFETELKAASETAEQRTFEEYYPPGETWLRVTVYPDEEGVSVYFTEITEQKQAEIELERNEQALRELQSLAADRTRTIDEKIGRALEVGCERLDVSVGFLTRIESGRQHVEVGYGSHDELEEGTSAPLSEAYCRKTIESDGLLTVADSEADGWTDDPAYARYGLDCYVGSRLVVDGELYGTFCLGDDEPQASFSEFERTFVEMLTEWVSVELERHEREQELERHEAVLESVEDAVYELDRDGAIVFVNRALCDLTGYPRKELLGRDVSELLDDDAVEKAEREIADAVDRGDDALTVELTFQPKGRRPLTLEDRVTILRDENGDFAGTIGIVRDVTDQQRHREQLSELLESSRTLMQARSREEVADMVVTAVKNVLGYEVNVVRLYDPDDEVLEPVAATDAVEEEMGTRPRYGLDDGPPGEVFASGEPRTYENLSTLDDGHDRSPLSGAMYFPMGVHGTLSIGLTDGDEVTDVDRQLGALLATSAAAACNRAKRESEVREARERVDALVDRINGLIEDTVEALVTATSREVLERDVCDRLVAEDAYEYAWVGRPDLASDTIRPSASEHCPDPDAEVQMTESSDDPTYRALKTHRPHVVEGLDEASGVHATADDRGMDALMAIPLHYRDTAYGVLTVYGSEADAFHEREQIVLRALGRAIGNAINAIERGRVFSTDQVVEMEVAVRDDDLLLSRLSAGANCSLRSAGTIRQTDDAIGLHLTTDDADPEDVLAVAEDDPAIRSCQCVVEHEGEALFEVTVEDSLVSMLAERGVVTQDVTADGGRTRLTVDVPYESEAREVFEQVESNYRQVDLLGYHEHERPVRTPQEFRAAVTDRFTDRQETAIRTAYLGGFFEWPRDVDGTELAEAMDVSRPTYHQHLRAAQRKVLEELFEPDA